MGEPKKQENRENKNGKPIKNPGGAPLGAPGDTDEKVGGGNCSNLAPIGMYLNENKEWMIQAGYAAGQITSTYLFHNAAPVEGREVDPDNTSANYSGDIYPKTRNNRGTGQTAGTSPVLFSLMTLQQISTLRGRLRIIHSATAGLYWTRQSGTSVSMEPGHARMRAS